MKIRALAGELELADGSAHRVETPTFSDLVYLDLALDGNATVTLPCKPAHELALYVVSGALELADATLAAHELGVLSDGDSLTLRASMPTRAVLLGGVPLTDPTVIYWNFITDTLEEAREREADWAAGRYFPKMPRDA